MDYERLTLVIQTRGKKEHFSGQAVGQKGAVQKDKEGESQERKWHRHKRAETQSVLIGT